MPGMHVGLFIGRQPFSFAGRSTRCCCRLARHTMCFSRARIFYVLLYTVKAMAGIGAVAKVTTVTTLLLTGYIVIICTAEELGSCCWATRCNLRGFG